MSYKKRRNYRTDGFWLLTPEEQAKVKRYLGRTKTSFRITSTKDGDEIVLLKITVSGVIPTLFKLLSGIGGRLLEPSDE